MDVCFASSSLICDISDYKVYNDVLLPSDHAPISLSITTSCVDTKHLEYRASCLGDHAVLYSGTRRERMKKPVRFDSINRENFIHVLSQQEPPRLDGDVDAAVNSMCTTLYESACRGGQVRYLVR